VRLFRIPRRIESAVRQRLPLRVKDLERYTGGDHVSVADTPLEDACDRWNDDERDDVITRPVSDLALHESERGRQRVGLEVPDR
jgi:hypothetical protein